MPLDATLLPNGVFALAARIPDARQGMRKPSLRVN
jgi:hypothetical protein